MSEEEKPKIVIDSDWKSQAEAERERLAQAEARASEKAGKGEQGELPPADFRGLVGTLATQAIMYLGGIADRQSGKVVVDLEMSRHFIDLLGVLEEKTKGNLTDEESEELSGLLNELRSRYVEFSKMVAQEMEKQGGGQPPTGGASGGGVIQT